MGRVLRRAIFTHPEIAPGGARFDEAGEWSGAEAEERAVFVVWLLLSVEEAVEVTASGDRPPG